MGEPRYVLDVQPATATVVIGTREDLLVDGVRVSAMSWIAGAPPADPEVLVKTRYRSAAGARPIGAGAADGEWEIWIDTPQEAAAPGQAAVVYRGDEVLGGGTIEGALRR